MNDTPRTSPDISEIETAKLPVQAFPATGKSGYRVFFETTAHDAIWSHARENTTIEICGVLVGKVRQDDNGPYLQVSHALRCDSATSKFAEVTFTHESWNEINQKMDADFLDFDIVGWYHTHPDFGIFLSDRDCFIHENFFAGPGQIAQVVDPIRQTEGVFVWRKSKPVPTEYFWIGDRIVADTHSEKVPGGAEPRRMSSGTPSPSAGGGDSAGSSHPDELPLPSWATVMNAVLPLVLAFLIGWMINGWRNSGRSEWEQQMIQQGVIDNFSLWKNLRPGLGTALDNVGRDLSAVEQNVAVLSEMHIQQTPEKYRAELNKKWSSTRAAMQSIRRETAKLRTQFGLTASEEEALNSVLQKYTGSRSKRPAPAVKTTPKADDTTPKTSVPATPPPTPSGGTPAKAEPPPVRIEEPVPKTPPVAPSSSGS